MNAHHKRADASAGTPATVALVRAGVGFTPHRYEHDAMVTSFGSEAAEKLGLEPARVFKTLLTARWSSVSCRSPGSST
jgi:Cys-tRNA(Pro)/Cys-tRNA(Cys) deacylase